MTRAEWTEIAEALCAVRRRSRGGTVMLVDKIANDICCVLQKRSTRFNPERFVQIARGIRLG